MVSTEQLLAAGLGPGAIKWRVRRGRLVPQHRGVYAVGHAARTPRARLWAAVLACGGPEAAAISHSAFAARRAPGPPHTGARSGSGQSRCRPQVTRRELEERMLALLAWHELPRPLVNTFVAGKEVDFLWPQARLIVETDGAATHLTATAFEEDRARDAKLAVAGYRVVRFTWRQLTERPGHTARTVRALLAGPNGANL